MTETPKFSVSGEEFIDNLIEENRKLNSDVSVYKSQRYAYKKKYLALLEANTELDAENQKLKEFKEKREESMFYFKAQMERAEPKTTSEAEDLQRAKKIFEKLYRKELNCLEEENQKLKEKIKRLEFDVDAWYQLKLLLEGEIEKLKEYNGELIENHKKDMAILCEENTKLEGKVKELKEKLNKAGLEEYGFFNEY